MQGQQQVPNIPIPNFPFQSQPQQHILPQSNIPVYKPPFNWQRFNEVMKQKAIDK